MSPANLQRLRQFLPVCLVMLQLHNPINVFHTGSKVIINRLCSMMGTGSSECSSVDQYPVLDFPRYPAREPSHGQTHGIHMVGPCGVRIILHSTAHMGVMWHDHMCFPHGCHMHTICFIMPPPYGGGALCFDGRCLSRARLCGGGRRSCRLPKALPGAGHIVRRIPWPNSLFVAALHVTMTVFLVLLYNDSICSHYFLWTVYVCGTLRFEMISKTMCKERIANE